MDIKKTIKLCLSATLCMALFTGCAGSPGGGVVNTDGSTSMEKVVGALGEAFMMQNDGVTVNYSGTGSGAGITAAQSGACDIGLASRDLKESETGVTATVLAKDGIAILVHPENPVSDLTVDQIAGLAAGEISNWKDVGGNDGPVAFIGREAGSGTRDGFESITGTAEQCKYTNELTSTGDVIASVAGNPNAIGYASLSAVDGTVKLVTVDGTAPSEAAVLDGTYPIQRDYNLIVKSDAPLSPAAQAFFDFATSPEAASIITHAGAVPVAGQEGTQWTNACPSRPRKGQPPGGAGNPARAIGL